MSIFKDSAVVLKIQKLHDKTIIYQVFSRDFGKISVTKKYSHKEKNIDLGNVINFEIVTKETAAIHKVRNIKILSALNIQSASFSIIHSYMEVLQKINLEFHTGIPNQEVFDLLVYVNQKSNLRDIDLLLAKLKIKSIEGELHITHKNPKIQKILSFINRQHFSTIMKLNGFNTEIIQELENLS